MNEPDTAAIRALLADDWPTSPGRMIRDLCDAYDRARAELAKSDKRYARAIEALERALAGPPQPAAEFPASLAAQGTEKLDGNSPAPAATGNPAAEALHVFEDSDMTRLSADQLRWVGVCTVCRGDEDDPIHIAVHQPQRPPPCPDPECDALYCETERAQRAAEGTSADASVHVVRETASGIGPYDFNRRDA